MIQKMKAIYLLGIDQSTQGTKAFLFDKNEKVLNKVYYPHEQIISPNGWVSHNPYEILLNVKKAIKDISSGIDEIEIAGIAITNQRETSVAWNKRTGEAAMDAIVWQCQRSSEIVSRLHDLETSSIVKEKTGIPLSPYFPASKFRWILDNCEKAQLWNQKGELCFGTMDSWLIYSLTGKHCTDYSNASRTQLLNIYSLRWDNELCSFFGIPRQTLGEVLDSNGDFGSTTVDGLFKNPIPILAVMGDSHSALYAHKCYGFGNTKVTYGTGSSIMMNTGVKIFNGSNGLITSVAWSKNGCTDYVVEGNINYSGAVVSWLEKDVGILDSPVQSSELANLANPADQTVLVPAFSGLGTPYWDQEAKAIICGMSRTTGRNEIVKAALESIAFQISDIIGLMMKELSLKEISVFADGAPAKNLFLMQKQADITGLCLCVSDLKEQSVYGVVLMAAEKLGIDAFINEKTTLYVPRITSLQRTELLSKWASAVKRALYRP